MPVKGSWGKDRFEKAHVEAPLRKCQHPDERSGVATLWELLRDHQRQSFSALTDLPGTLQPPVFQEGCGHEHMINSASRNSS